MSGGGTTRPPSSGQLAPTASAGRVSFLFVEGIEPELLDHAANPVVGAQLVGYVVGLGIENNAHPGSDRILHEVVVAPPVGLFAHEAVKRLQLPVGVDRHETDRIGKEFLGCVALQIPAFLRVSDDRSWHWRP